MQLIENHDQIVARAEIHLIDLSMNSFPFFKMIMIFLMTLQMKYLSNLSASEQKGLL